MREILRLAQRKNLLRYAPAEDPADAIVEILPTLKRVISFQNVEEWTRHAERYLSAADDAPSAKDALASEETDEGGDAA
jgi:hypothetical protein